MAARSPAHRALGGAVRSFREDAGLSQEELGFAAGLDRTYVGGVERGERNPTFEVLLKLCKGLRTTPAALLARAESAR